MTGKRQKAIDQLADALRYYRKRKPAIDYNANFFKQVARTFRVSERLLDEALKLEKELEEAAA